MQVKKQQLEPDMEQQTGSKLGKEYIKAVYCHPTYSAVIYLETPTRLITTGNEEEKKMVLSS